MNPDKLSICKSTRQIASNALFNCLKQLLSSEKPISEIDLRNKWIEEMRKSSSIFSDGWYIPPPHGIGVLFGDDKNIERINTSSLRIPGSWPRDDIFLNRKNGIVFIYTSPVDKQTGIIGDFGLTLYFGNNQDIKKHLQTCFSIDKQIFEHIQINMHFSEITNFTLKLFSKNGLINNIASPNDPTGTNVGHTIPISYENWSNDELTVLQNGTNDWNKVCTLISKKRKFINVIEQLQIKPNMAFTIEPRPMVLNHPEIPQVWFHNIAMLKQDGSKELLTNFDEIFKIIGMDYMI